MGYFGSDEDLVFDGRVFPEQGHSQDEVMELLANFERQDVSDVYAHNTIQSTTLMGHLEAAESYCLPSFQPPALKVVLDPVTDEVVDTFVRDLAEVIPLVRSGTITIDAIEPWL